MPNPLSQRAGRTLRTWTAPDGVVFRWNAEHGVVERRSLNNSALWVIPHTTEVLDYANELRELRNDPYEPEHYSMTVNGEVFVLDGGKWHWSDTTIVTAAWTIDMLNEIRALRERDDLNEYATEALAAELVKRGWKDKTSVLNNPQHNESPRVHVVRSRYLLAPEPSHA